MSTELGDAQMTGSISSNATSFEMGIELEQLPDRSFSIKYQDADYNTSDRQITTIALRGYKDGIPRYLHAYCHQKQAERTFKIDRIEEYLNPLTGEIYQHFGHFMHSGVHDLKWPVGIIDKIPKYLADISRVPAILNADCSANIVQSQHEYVGSSQDLNELIENGMEKSDIKTTEKLYNVTSISAYYYGLGFMLETRAQTTTNGKTWKGKKRFYDIALANIDGIEFRDMRKFVTYIVQRCNK